MLVSGTIVEGFWHKSAYRICRELGRGSMGVVYIVENCKDSQLYAMKVAHSMQSIASEWKRLDTIQKQVQSKYFGPVLFEMDDIKTEDRRLYFYTMEYIDGKNLNDLKSKMSIQQYLACICQLATHLHKLHLKKRIFADVKPENIIIESSNHQVRLVDFGGVVSVGGLVKQYSAIYDRGSWKMGNRTADFQYDLFAVGIMILQKFVGRDSLCDAQKKPLPMFALYDIIHNELHPRLKQICIKIFSEKYASAEQMYKELQQVVSEPISAKRSSNSCLSAVILIDSVFWSSLLFMVGSICYVVSDAFRW